MYARVILLLTSVAACAAAPQPPALRLGDKVKPLHYQLHLTVDPAKDDYRGSLEIALDIRETTSFFWLNTTGLTIDASLTHGSQTSKATVEPDGQDWLSYRWWAGSFVTMKRWPKRRHSLRRGLPNSTEGLACWPNRLKLWRVASPGKTPNKLAWPSSSETTEVGWVVAPA